MVVSSVPAIAFQEAIDDVLGVRVFEIDSRNRRQLGPFGRFGADRLRQQACAYQQIAPRESRVGLHAKVHYKSSPPRMELSPLLSIELKLERPAVRPISPISDMNYLP